MTPAEMTIVVLVYVGTLLLTQRVAAFGLPDVQEVCFAVAAVVGSLVAGFLYHRRRWRPAPAMVVFSAAAAMAVLALVVGQLIELLWQPFGRPAVVMPVAAAGTLLLPFLFFRTGRALAGEGHENAEPIAVTHVILVAVAAVGLVAIALMIPTPGHSSVRLFPQKLPGLTISLPDWQIEEKNTRVDSGTVRLADPGGGDHFLSVRWADSPPVQPDDYVNVIFAGTMKVRDSAPAEVRGRDGRGHDGRTFQLAPTTSSEGDVDDLAIATIWYCEEDHRVMWIVSHLAGSHAAALATHQRIVESVRCHTGEGKPATGAAAADRVFPGFAPPSGYARDSSNPALLRFVGPRRQTIVFDAAVPGRSNLVESVVTPDMVATLLQGSGTMKKVEGSPQLRTVSDLLGHQRRVWTVTGTAPDGTRIQVEVMVWWCDRRDMTFVGTYLTQGPHDPNEGINALLPAVCHTE